MRAVVCPEPHQIRLIETDRPAAKEGEALVRVVRIGVCGTDMHVVRGENPYFEYPRVLGHELAAEVAGKDTKINTEVIKKVEEKRYEYEASATKDDANKKKDAAKTTAPTKKGGGNKVQYKPALLILEKLHVPDG